MEKKNEENGVSEDMVHKYEEPKIVTYTRDDILTELGPVQAVNTGVDTGNLFD